MLFSLLVSFSLHFVVVSEISVKSIIFSHEVTTGGIWSIDKGVINVLMVLPYSVSEPRLLNHLFVSHMVPLLSRPWMNICKIAHLTLRKVVLVVLASMYYVGVQRHMLIVPVL